MRKLSLTFMLALFVGLNSSFAQEENKEGGYIFTSEKEVKHTSVKDQNRSGTCWSYSGMGLMEAELLRLGKGEYDLSEMWVVNKSYNDKADIYVRMHGNYNFSGGGAFFDVINTIKKYGIVPETVYSGNNYGEVLPVHGELDAILEGYVKAVVSNPNKKLSLAWKKGYNAVIESYLGIAPENFTFQGKEYTPQTFAQRLGLPLDDYISLTSFTHHPFYTSFAIEIPDNWAQEVSWNITLDELLQTIRYAIDNGYTVAWGADVSDKGFNWGKGVAVLPEKDFDTDDGSDRARWEKLSKKDQDEELYSFEKPGKEKNITQQNRQDAFDNYTTTDDHGMLIVGTATDQNGTPYFKVKNSWGEKSSNPYQGYFYASEPFIKMQTINIVVHKDAIPKEIRKKLNIK
ncbi:MAG: aminopeptidase [Bacteroidales bacterium]|jgi:bleomycin hydrolase|nr:aminopeptidase [Bacteroidales bacterium]